MRDERDDPTESSTTEKEVYSVNARYRRILDPVSPSSAPSATHVQEWRSSTREQIATMAAVRFMNCVAGKSGDAKEDDGAVLDQRSTGLALRRLCAADGGGAAKSLLLPGASPEHRAEV